MATITGKSQVGTVGSEPNLWGLFGKHLEKRAQRGLFAMPVLYELADKHPLPAKSGRHMYIPRHFPKNEIVALTEGTPLRACATSTGFYSGAVLGYGDVRSYSDFLVTVEEVMGMVANDVDAMSRYAGYKVDNLIRTVLSGGPGTWVSPDGGATGVGDVQATTNLKQAFLFAANATLASNNAPRYSDGYYHGVFHPRQTYDLFINTSAGSQLSRNATTIGAGFLEATEFGARKLERATMGALGGIRVLESTESAKFLYHPTSDSEANAGGMESSNSGWGAFVMGPGAVAAVDLETARLQVKIKTEGGTYDPIDQIKTAGVKFYFTAIAMDTTNRLVTTASGKTL